MVAATVLRTDGNWVDVMALGMIAMSVVAKASIKVGRTAELMAYGKGVQTGDEMVGQTVDGKASKQVVWKVVAKVVWKAGKMGKF